MKIGKIELTSKYVLAPLAGFSDVGFRSLAYKYGAGLCTTEMVSAKGLVYNSKNTKSLLATDASEPIKCVQLFGSEIPFIVKAVQSSEIEKFDIIDFNFGCPMKKIVTNGEGSALMQKPQLVYDIIKACVDSTNKPVTAKIRAGFTAENKNAAKIAQMIEKAGASAITVHGRTRDMYYSGKTDLNIIKDVVEAVSIPVIGNGDVVDKFSADKMLEETGCAGVAIGRGAVGSPQIFSVLNDVEKTYNIASQIKYHVEKFLEHNSEKVVVNYMKKHLASYLKGIRMGKEIKQEIFKIKAISDIFTIMDNYSNIFYNEHNT